MEDGHIRMWGLISVGVGSFVDIYAVGRHIILAYKRSSAIEISRGYIGALLSSFPAAAIKGTFITWPTAGIAFAESRGLRLFFSS